MRKKQITYGGIFWDAMKRNGFGVNDAAEFFNVSRITIYNWKTGRFAIPVDAFISIVFMENEYHKNQQRLRKIYEKKLAEQQSQGTDSPDGQ